MNEDGLSDRWVAYVENWWAKYHEVYADRFGAE